ncbi:MAG: FAD-dependent oxidoreductase [Burkholderiaceae bacterium]
MNDKPDLFSPFELSGIPLRNRIAHLSMTTLRAAQGKTTANQIQYYANRAQGGAGLIVTEPFTLSPLQDVPHKTRAWNDDDLDGLKRFADAVEKYDTRLLAQIQDPGRARHHTGKHLAAMAPSAIPDDMSWSMPSEISASTIQQLVDDFSKSALRLKQCGFSGVELSCGHGHLFHQFLSPRSNHREDDYGGSWDNRVRFVQEIVQAIRQTCGKRFIVGLKLPGDDGYKDSVGVIEAAIIAKKLTASQQVSYVLFAQGTHGQTLDMHVPDRYGTRMPYRSLQATLRQQLPSVVMMSAGRITDPAEAQTLLDHNEADLIGLGRALIADPAWPIKYATGRTHDIRYCVSCNTCWDTIITHRLPLACVNNPRVAWAEEVDWWPTQKVEKQKRIVVVGAGFAGMEAAWVAAARGHDVTVLSKGSEPGGKARLRAHLDGGEEVSSVYDYQTTAAQRAGVKFIGGITAQLSDVIALKPDAVVLATGSEMVHPDWLPKAIVDETIVPDLRTAMQNLLHMSQHQSGTAVIYDMDHSEATYASAQRLKKLFDRVVIVTPRHTIADDMAVVTRQGVLRRLSMADIEMITLSQPIWNDAFENGQLQIQQIYNHKISAIDDVVFLAYSTPRRRCDQLKLPLEQMGIAVFAIGDCLSPRDMISATSDGHAIGMKL